MFLKSWISWNFCWIYGVDFLPDLIFGNLSSSWTRISPGFGSRITQNLSGLLMRFWAQILILEPCWESPPIGPTWFGPEKKKRRPKFHLCNCRNFSSVDCFSATFLAPYWTVLRDSTFGLIFDLWRTTSVFWAWRDSALNWVKIAKNRRSAFPPKQGSSLGKTTPRIPDFRESQFGPRFSKIFANRSCASLLSRKVQFGPSPHGCLYNYALEVLFTSILPRNCIFLFFCTKTKNISKYANSWYFSI